MLPADYPAHLASRRTLPDGRSVLIRPVRPDDEAAEKRFFDSLSEKARALRFMRRAGAPDEGLVHFFTHIDYTRHMAFVCEAEVEGGPVIVGEARYLANADGRSCEFGVVVADGWHASGVGWLLMQALMEAARAKGLQAMAGLVLPENAEMLHFVESLGFAVEREGARNVWRVTRDLQAP